MLMMMNILMNLLIFKNSSVYKKMQNWWPPELLKRDSMLGFRSPHPVPLKRFLLFAHLPTTTPLFLSTSAKYAKKWLGGPNMSIWPQQINFAFGCATTGCGVSREILFSSGSSLKLTPQIHSFYLFHVYYTTRKILYELGGI